MFHNAISEIRNGRKESCWIWFILPTPPYFVQGKEVGSTWNRYYALRSDEEVLAYLAFADEKINLRRNYIEILNAISEQLQNGFTLFLLFGPGDSKKVKSSVMLFARIAQRTGDEDLQKCCKRFHESLLLPRDGGKKKSKIKKMLKSTLLHKRLQWGAR